MKMECIISGIISCNCGSVQIMNKWGQDELDSLARSFEGREVQMLVMVKEVANEDQ